MNSWTSQGPRTQEGEGYNDPILQTEKVRQRDSVASLCYTMTHYDQQPETRFPDSWFNVPHIMLPSTKYYFCKGFSFNKGNRTSHVTFIHESLCVFISTLAACSWERGRSGVPFYLISTRAGRPNQESVHGRKIKGKWFVNRSHCGSKNIQVLCFKTSNGQSF